MERRTVIDGAARLSRGVCLKAVARDRRGVAAVEFAVLAPFLVLMMLPTADLGLAIYAEMQVQTAAQAGTGYAFLHGYDSTAISSAVTSASTISGLTASPVPSQFCGCPGASGVTSQSCNSNCSSGNAAGTYVSASATAVYHTIISYPGIPGQYTFASTSTVRIK